MRKFLLLMLAAVSFVAGAPLARAADMGIPPAVYPYAPAPHLGYVFYNWSGVYLGINGGWDWANATTTNAPLGLSASGNTNGGLIGGTVGANIAFGPAVFGLEGDFDYAGLSTGGLSSHWLATVRGRAGYAWDRWWVYGTAGAAFAPVNVSVLGFNGSTTQAGWTVGVGTEWAFSYNWTAKIEYLFVDLGTANFAPASVSLRENLVRVGVNYKF